MIRDIYESYEDRILVRYRYFQTGLWMSFFRLFEHRFSTSCSLLGVIYPHRLSTFGICSVAVESHEWKATIIRESLHKSWTVYHMHYFVYRTIYIYTYMICITYIDIYIGQNLGMTKVVLRASWGCHRCKTDRGPSYLRMSLHQVPNFVRKSYT